MNIQQEEEEEIEEDMTVEERQKNKDCYIKGNKLVLEKKEFSIEDLIELDNQENKRANSNPATPTPPNDLNPRGNIKKIEENKYIQHQKNIQQAQASKQAENTPETKNADKSKKPFNLFPEKITRSRKNSQK
ncbi:hypothetical protein JTB14_032163 [Gonioctena quinquepunctata]|nr:hypothetical protein JTB14_032163 [Gonioctena quinquepunctata]